MVINYFEFPVRPIKFLDPYFIRLPVRGCKLRIMGDINKQAIWAITFECRP